MFPRNLTKEFNLDALRMLGLAASASYCKPHEAEQRARAAGATVFHWIESSSTDTQVLIAANASDVVIAPRGTDDVRDWITDCKFVRRRFDGIPGEIHQGFGEALLSVRDEIRQVTFELAEHRDVWIGAHSLGFGIGSPLAWDLVNGGIPLAGAYGFGGPRVGNAEYVAAYNSNPMLRERTFRIENRNDIVTRVPGALIGFRKEGHRVFIDSLGNVELDPPIWKKVVSDVYGIACELHEGTRLKAIGTLVQDHFMAAYLERIAA